MRCRDGYFAWLDSRLLDSIVTSIEAEPPPTPQEVFDQLDVLHWFRFMLDLPGDVEGY
jgi:hypothetical protein